MQDIFSKKDVFWSSLLINCCLKNSWGLANTKFMSPLEFVLIEIEFATVVVFYFEVDICSCHFGLALSQSCIQKSADISGLKDQPAKLERAGFSLADQHMLCWADGRRAISFLIRMAAIISLWLFQTSFLIQFYDNGMKWLSNDHSLLYSIRSKIWVRHYVPFRILLCQN